MKKILRVDFRAFWPGFVPERSWFWHTLSRRFNLRLHASRPHVRFQSVFGRRVPKQQDVVNVFYTGEDRRPDWHHNHLSVSFDRDEHGGRNYRLPLYVTYFDDPEQLAWPEKRFRSGLKRDGFCDIIYSNPAIRTPRAQFAGMLLARCRKCTIGGQICKTLVERNTLIQDTLTARRMNLHSPEEAKAVCQSRHRFSMAFENASTPGYITEKVAQPIHAGSLPVYWGAPDIGQDFNVERMLILKPDSSQEDMQLLVDCMWSMYQKPEQIEEMLSHRVFPASGTPPHWSRDRFLDWLERGIEDFNNGNR